MLIIKLASRNKNVFFKQNKKFQKHKFHIYQQNVGVPMGTNCAPLVADLFLYSYEADFVHLHKK